MPEVANCPNVGDCWSRGTATIMIMGSVCTRNCRFCAVKKGKVGEAFDPSEPERIAIAIKKVRLKHVVLTSVDRDDLIDGGAGHFADCIMALKQLRENIIIEALIPDFSGNTRCLEKIIDANPDIIGHNIETTREFQAFLQGIEEQGTIYPWKCWEKSKRFVLQFARNLLSCWGWGKLRKWS